MKASEFARFLRAAADLRPDTALGGAARCFEARPAATVAAILKVLPREEPSLWASPQSLAASLEDFRPLAEAIGKAGVVKDLDDFAAALRRGPPEATKPRAPSKARKPATPLASPAQMAAYLRELTEALNDRQRFAEVFQRLSNDKAVGLSALKALALDFARAPAKSRTDALKRILARHQNLAGMDAKSRATGGRTAA